MQKCRPKRMNIIIGNGGVVPNEGALCGLQDPAVAAVEGQVHRGGAGPAGDRFGLEEGRPGTDGIAGLAVRRAERDPDRRGADVLRKAERRASRGEREGRYLLVTALGDAVRTVKVDLAAK